MPSINAVIDMLKDIQHKENILKGQREYILSNMEATLSGIQTDDADMNMRIQFCIHCIKDLRAADEQ